MSCPDLVLYNGRIYPEVDKPNRFEAVAVSEGKISHLGSSADLLKLAAPSTTKIDLHGKTVLPGFHDSHIHLLNFGMLLKNLDLTGTTSINELTRQVYERASNRSKEKWILGRGWDDERLMDHRYPDRYDLDRATRSPVFLKRICGHIAVANSAALSKAGIDLNTPDPEGGVIARDSQGRPTGILKERAIELVERVIPRSQEETEEALVLASNRLAKLGLTSLHCVVGDLSELKALRSLKRQHKIAQFIYALIQHDALDELGLLDRPTTDTGFQIGAVKLFLDGSLGGRTAALNAPYNDSQDDLGMLTMTPMEIQKITLKATRENLQLCIHAIGDKAVELAIQTISDAVISHPQHNRHRIEHASVTPPELILKMAENGIVASVQPRFIYSDTWAAQRLGKTRLDHLYAFHSMIAAGVPIAAGSDCPVEDPNPFEGIWSAIVRPGLSSSERLSVSQVLAAYTVNAAYASFSEDTRGKLKVGYVADMVVVDRDPFECSPADLRKSRVLKTLINGLTVA